MPNGTEATGWPQPDQPQRGPDIPPGYAAQAAQAVGAVQDDAGTDAGVVIDQIRQQVTRDVLLPMEQQINQMMADAKASQDALKAQIAALQQQLVSTQAQLGPPGVVKYAQAVRDKLVSVAASKQNIGQDHFADVITLGGKLADDAAQVGTGEAKPDVLASTVSAIERWLTRTSPRTAGHIEGLPTILADLEYVAEEAAKLAPEAAAVAAAV